MTEFLFRNKANGLTGLMTPEQAALFPDVLEFVEAPAEVPAEQAATATSTAPGKGN